ncbi:2-amino-4-hydroxy-6-hydroxymethyldihydropteridine diphosphokinase [uncultured Photobacterium sp.]|uniref:2-amino-4-hydroxy-6- hydroxymethyldihydropteridine diphosphokinase n=1 Tax=uncultured Photobacterium sp. TaxID=173973 RepID=UPI002632C53F|nr:2-amino-4-hydroxy-6-hydroxymethyldihydropteridine diphosphokinase [uncultured Photobacterium sp.]
MTTVYISIGSNIEREYHIHAAVAELKKLGAGIRVSKIFEAEPVGFSGPNFYNCVVEMETSLQLAVLQQTLKQVELTYGRAPDAQKNQSRTLDLDILLFGDVVQDNSPHLPRSDLYKFAFVLLPMVELCPERVIPGDGRTVSEIWQAFEHTQALWPVEKVAC